MTLGAMGYVGYGKETTEGTPVAPTIFLPVDTFGFEDSNDTIQPRQIRGDRDIAIALPAPYNVDGSMEMELVPQGIAKLLQSAAAGTTATVNGASGDVGSYTHTITPGAALAPTFTFESSAADILVMRYGGIRVNTLEISASFGEIVKATFGLMGTTRAKQASAGTEDYTIFTQDPLHYDGAEIKVAGTQIATAKDFTFTTGNNLERIGTVRKTRSYRRTALGGRDVGLSATLDFTDTAEYQRFLDDVWFTVDLNFTGGVIGSTSKNYTLSIALPKVKWNKVGVPLSAGDFLEQSVEAVIVKPSASAIYTMTLINNEATPFA